MVALIQLMPNLDPWYCVTVEIFSMCPRKYLQTKNILQWNKISYLFILLLTYFKGGAFRLFSYQKLINLKGVQDGPLRCILSHNCLILNTICDLSDLSQAPR